MSPVCLNFLMSSGGRLSTNRSRSSKTALFHRIVCDCCFFHCLGSDCAICVYMV